MTLDAGAKHSGDVGYHQEMRIAVTTPVYEGPLDLLLQLIERAELDITRLALAQVTDQYLEHIHNIQHLEAEEVSAFLVIATKLIQIKSEALLPRPPRREIGEEDPGEALARQLIAYKRYRAIADLLAKRETAGLRTYLRLAPPPHIVGNVDLSGFGLNDLVTTAQTILYPPDVRPSLNIIVAPLRISIRDQIKTIVRLLKEHGQATFRSTLGGKRSRLEIVVTFIAMLELIKRHFVHAQQEKLFGDIFIEKEKSWDNSSNTEEEFELEFGE